MTLKGKVGVVIVILILMCVIGAITWIFDMGETIYNDKLNGFDWVKYEEEIFSFTANGGIQNYMYVKKGETMYEFYDEDDERCIDYQNEEIEPVWKSATLEHVRINISGKCSHYYSASELKKEPATLRTKHVKAVFDKANELYNELRLKIRQKLRQNYMTECALVESCF